MSISIDGLSTYVALLACDLVKDGIYHLNHKSLNTSNIRPEFSIIDDLKENINEKNRGTNFEIISKLKPLEKLDIAFMLCLGL